MGIEVKELPAVQDIRSIVEELHRMYLDEVAGGKKTYSRFVEDYISSHRELPIFLSSEGLRRFNIEAALRGKINAILLTRQDIVESCLSSTVVSDETIDALLTFLDSTGIDRSHSTVAVNSCEHVTDWIALAKVINRLRLFRQVISAGELECLLTTGDTVNTYTASVTFHLAYLLNILCEKRLISPYWQSIMCSNKRVLSSRGKILVASDFSSAVEQAKQEKTHSKKVYFNIRRMLDDELF